MYRFYNTSWEDFIEEEGFSNLSEGSEFSPYVTSTKYREIKSSIVNYIMVYSLKYIRSLNYINREELRSKNRIKQSAEHIGDFIDFTNERINENIANFMRGYSTDIMTEDPLNTTSQFLENMEKKQQIKKDMSIEIDL